MLLTTTTQKFISLCRNELRQYVTLRYKQTGGHFICQQSPSSCRRHSKYSSWVDIVRESESNDVQVVQKLMGRGRTNERTSQLHPSTEALNQFLTRINISSCLNNSRSRPTRLPACLSVCASTLLFMYLDTSSISIDIIILHCSRAVLAGSIASPTS